VSFELQDLIGGTGVGTFLGVNGHTGVSDTLYLDDPIFFDNDVHGTDGRRPGPIDQRDASENEAVEGTVSFGSWRCLGDRFGLTDGGNGQ
jgi:hypothetical protein